MGAIKADQLLAKLRLSPAAAPIDLMQTPLHVWLNGDLIDIDDLITVLDEDGAPGQNVSVAAAEAGGSIERYGRWLREWWPEVRDDLTLLPEDCDFTEYALLWAVVVVGNWTADGLVVDIDVDSPLLSPADGNHMRALSRAAGDYAYLVALNGVVVDQRPSQVAGPGASDAG